MAFTLYTLAGKMGVTWTKLLWRTPLCVTNQLTHCHLFEQGAKVLTRRTNERLAEAMEAMMKKLCQANR